MQLQHKLYNLDYKIPANFDPRAQENQERELMGGEFNMSPRNSSRLPPLSLSSLDDTDDDAPTPPMTPTTPSASYSQSSQTNDDLTSLPHTPINQEERRRSIISLNDEPYSPRPAPLSLSDLDDSDFSSRDSSSQSPTSSTTEDYPSLRSTPRNAE